MKVRSIFVGISAALAAGVPLAAAGQTMDKLAVPVCANARCGVIDQDGKVLLPFENKFSAIYSSRPGNSVFVAVPKARDSAWRLVSADGKTTLKGEFDSLRFLTPGYYGVGRGDKMGIIDDQGTEVQPIRFDDLYVVGEGQNQYITYEIGGKQGVLSAKGEKISAAVYEDLNVPIGRLVLGKRDGSPWMINLDTKAEQPATFDYLVKPSADGVMVAKNLEGRTYGLVDAQGKVLIPQGKYEWMGSAGNGYVSFKKENEEACGYMDYTGKVVIKPQFATCNAFGKLGAMAQARGADGKPGSFGLIGRQGQWLQPPRYGSAALAGLGLLTQDHFHDVPGHASIVRQRDDASLGYGIFNTDEGKELFAPEHLLMGALTPELFVFSDNKAPKINASFMGSPMTLSATGLMDRTGKVLLKPRNLIGFTLDPSGRFILGHEGTAVHSKIALFDFGGNQVIAPEWQKLEVDVQRGYILAHEVYLDRENHQQSELRALFDLTGRPVFTVKQFSCGAEQVLDATGHPIWPANPTAYCRKKKNKK